MVSAVALNPTGERLLKTGMGRSYEIPEETRLGRSNVLTLYISFELSVPDISRSRPAAPGSKTAFRRISVNDGLRCIADIRRSPVNGTTGTEQTRMGRRLANTFTR